jgi:hypothetical protein
VKSLRIVLPACAIGVLLFAATAVAQDADKAKLIEIEKAFSASPDPGPQSAAVNKQYIYDGPVSQLTMLGRIGTLPKARVVELASAPDPSDPNARSAQTLTDFHVDIYGTTALVSYKQTNVDTGHKDPALNITNHITCLDTFVKSNGAWYIVGDACSSSTPVSQAAWNAYKKAMTQAPKDVQQAYH